MFITSLMKESVCSEAITGEQQSKHGYGNTHKNIFLIKLGK
jgi:hypothetical protein